MTMKSPLLASLLLVNFYLDAASSTSTQVATKKQKPAKRALTKRKPSDGPCTLTATNVKETLKGKLTIVLVGADWCVHCKKMSPLFAESYKTAGEDVTYAYLSLGEHFGDKTSLLGQLQRDYNVGSINVIPSFLVFKKGTFLESHEGSLTKEQLTAFVKKHTAQETPPPTEEASQKQPVPKK